MSLPTPRENLGIPGSGHRPPWWFEVLAWVVTFGIIAGGILIAAFVGFVAAHFIVKFW